MTDTDQEAMMSPELAEQLCAVNLEYPFRFTQEVRGDALIPALVLIAVQGTTEAVRAWQQLDKLAKSRGQPRDQLLEHHLRSPLPAGGEPFDVDGEKLWATVIELGEVALCDEAGVARGGHPSTQQSRDRLRYLREQVELRTLTRIEILERALWHRRRMPWHHFEGCYLENPLCAPLITRVIWLGWSSEGQPLGSFRIADGQLEDHEERPYNHHPAEIGLACPNTTDEQTWASWRALIAEYHIVPLFRQWERGESW